MRSVFQITSDDEATMQWAGAEAEWFQGCYSWG
jgi:hypothetical protein